ncbi:uncharacterized protein LOC135683201 isoform X2 [Rhopilema esculentum]
MKSTLYRCLAMMLLIEFNEVSTVHASQEIPCQLVNDIEETDPVERALTPAFYRIKKCKGGSRLRSGYQCQASSTETKEIEVFNRLTLSKIKKKFESATECKEVCVCGRKCNAPEKAQCDRGFRWDAEECRCVCDKSNSIPYRGNRKTETLSIKYLVISILAISALFAAVISILACICKEKKHKYKHLAVVHWNKQARTKLERYQEYVDWSPRAGGKSRWCCYTDDNERQALVQNGDNKDAVDNAPNFNHLTAVDCFEIGYIEFKMGRYEPMLKWMNIAREKWESDNRLPDGVNRDIFLHDLYQYLSIASLADKSWNVEDAAKYKQMALRIAARRTENHEDTNGRVNNEVGAPGEITNGNNPSAC